MRITEFEKSVIIRVTKTLFSDFELFLFGSRVDDTKKGGDIDIYIKLRKKLNIDKLIEKETTFLTELQKEIGFQKIDLVINNNDENNKIIYQMAESTGIKLC